MLLNRTNLLSITKPGRYVGGELGTIVSHSEESLKIALCFPDLYEIGMSNYAMKILYNLLNSIPGVQCERVFAPFPDYEELLREKQIPLTTLENQIPLCDCDILAFSIGYELQATNILNILDLGGIPIRSIDRGKNGPYTVAGGPSVSNPLPLSSFIDSFYIGEAEAGFSGIIEKVLNFLKERGKEALNRREIASIFNQYKMIWSREKREASRAIQADFGSRPLHYNYFPVPSIQVVQEHGTVEIMRGCPNKCRFCHAGIYYRPMRQKSIQMILDEVDFLVTHCGFTSISLASLSSGDYNELEILIDELNSRYRSSNITFSVPSLRVNSLNLTIIEKLSHGKKSGLTFAIETPVLEWQKSINKVVDKEKIIGLLELAKEKGWKSAKFYFMIGLPESMDSPDPTEIEAIAAYLTEIRQAVRINLTVNIGIFIPKPHTVYEEANQLDWEEGQRLLGAFKRSITDKGIRVSYQEPFSSYVEGVISRGGEDTGEFIVDAFNRGARFDAWSDHFDKDIWKSILSGDQAGELNKIFHGDYRNEWKTIDLRLSPTALKKEQEKSKRGETTINCDTVCQDHCGVCREEIKVVTAKKDELKPFDKSINLINENILRFKIVFSKKGRAIYWGHLDVVEVFIRAFQRSGLKLRYSNGYRPKPRLEFASPLSLGIFSEHEIVSADLHIDTNCDIELIKDLLNKNLPDDISILSVSVEKNCDKETKITRRYWGSSYSLSLDKENQMTAEILLEKLIFCIEKNGANDFYQLELSKDSSIKITCREFDSTYRIMKLLKEVYDTNLPLANPVKLTRLVTLEKGKHSIDPPVLF